MHIYAFGSICRGEVAPSSDVDLLAIVEGTDDRFNQNDYSIYSYFRIEKLWEEGNPFAWHLSLESKLIFSSDKTDFIDSLEKPSPYIHGIRDCEKFQAIFDSACESLEKSRHSEIFDLSSIFLSIRNFATCYSLAMTCKPDFSRNSAIRLGPDSLPIDQSTYSLLENSRILCTRGKGDFPSKQEIKLAINSIPVIKSWMETLIHKIRGK